MLGALHKKNLISYQHVFDAECLWWFGRLINNSDMHLGNLSFAIEGDVFRLLPVYDMCSMGFAPKSGREVLPYRFVPPEIKGINISADIIGLIQDWARNFWERVASDARISDEFKEFIEHANLINLAQPNS